MNRHFAARDVNISFNNGWLIDMSGYGFGVWNYDAENYNSIINANQQTYRGVTDPAMFRAHHMGHNFGWPSVFLGFCRIKREWVEANGGPEAVFDQLYGLELLHDGGGVHGILPGIMGELQNRRQNDIKEFGLSHWIYQFTPYWHQDIVKLPDENLHASFYIARPSKLAATANFSDYFDRLLPYYIKVQNNADTEAARKEFAQMKDRAVMIVYNNTAWEGVMRLKPDWKKIGLGLPADLTASNFLHRTGFRLEKTGEKDKDGKEVEKPVFFDRPEEYARIDGEELVFPMTKWNYRMIVLSGRSATTQ